jgi:hypothetical protein
MRIEILHPIEHDGKRFERGMVELVDELAKLFLSFKNAAAPGGVAKEVKGTAGTAAESAGGTPAPQPVPATAKPAGAAPNGAK